MLLNIFVMSVIIERVWEHLQQIIGDSYLSARVKVLGSAVIALAASLSFRLDLLHALDIAGEVSTAGFVLTGFVLALGSNVVHDLVEIIGSLKTGQKAVALEVGPAGKEGGGL